MTEKIMACTCGTKTVSKRSYSLQWELYENKSYYVCSTHSLISFEICYLFIYGSEETSSDKGICIEALIVTSTMCGYVKSQEQEWIEGYLLRQRRQLHKRHDKRRL